MSCLLCVHGERVRTLAIVVGVLGAASPVLADVSPVIINVGIVPSTSTSRVLGVSRDGSTAIGTCSNNHAFRWTPATGIQDIGTLPGSTSAGATAANADGSVVVGWSDGPGGRRAFRWTAEAGMQDLGTLANTTGGQRANAVSGDGNTIVGLIGSNGPAFRWTAAGGMQPIYPGDPRNALQSEARSISTDGQVVVGTTSFSGSRGYRWTAPNSTTFLQNFGYSVSANASSGNGLVTVGIAYANFEGLKAVRWDAAGQIQALPQVNGRFSTPRAANFDGSISVGEQFGGYPNGHDQACIWSDSFGVRDLGGYLTSQGVDITGWEFTTAFSISDNGQTIGGFGYFNGDERGYLITIPSPGGAATLGVLSIWAGCRRRAR